MTSSYWEIDPAILDELERYSEKTTNEIERDYGGRPETHSYRVDQIVLNTIESWIERHFRVCGIHEVFMERIRKSKNFSIGEDGKIILTKKLGNKLDRQAKNTITEIIKISQELRKETGVPAEVFTMRLFLNFITILTKIYREAKSGYLREDR